MVFCTILTRESKRTAFFSMLPNKKGSPVVSCTLCAKGMWLLPCKRLLSR